ncbi:SDR family NAD(P)-dependent oxidoreductase [Ruegeria marina]|uniref:NAD(P)-dependent dehydrogenase, short-chain alcohol dehydrogenase family n=1 Tax=Ruegeria marina TaxID=639004 RepID=A0A1G6ZNN7_9RHOB|nr:SDR family oxidoreductase [Ruegeria marina]SDE04150.1 NAD(P)-dependent dehydrogenase, short-chain alcohol dehydrogenase family [Ruegeria marina]
MMRDLAKPSPALAERFSLAGRRALVTGASGVLGARFAQVLAEAGAAVTLAARRVEPMLALRDRIEGAGGQACVVPLDLADAPTIAAAFDTAEEALGGPVDLVVNNSGIASPGLLLEQSEDDWAQLMAVNLDGARRVAAEAARRLVAAGEGGSIVNVASILGLRQGAGVAAYATSKAALVQLTKQQALEWARHGIRVNALCPGYIETDINRDFFASDAGQAQVKRIPMRRLGRPSELDGALLLLASEAGSFMTGTALVADGGHLLNPL